MSEWSDYRVFLEVHRAGSLSGAGRAMGVYPSTIGRRVAALEEAIGTVLFHRTPEGLVTTAAATEMVPVVEAMERQALLLNQGLSGQSQKMEGRVRVGMTVEFAGHFFADRIASFSKRHPGIELDLRTGSFRADLTGGEVDIAVRFALPGSGAPVSNQESELVIARRLGEIGFALYASSAYLKRRGTPRGEAELVEHDFILPSPGKSWMPGYEWILERAEGARVALRTDALEAMRVAAARGLGLTLLPSFIAARSKSLQRLGVGGILGERSTWILMPRNLRHVARVRATWDYLVELMEAHADELAARV